MTYREFIDSREAFTAEEEEAYNATSEPTVEDMEEMCDYFESLDMGDFEDDGQPDEMQEWDDLYGYGPEY